MGLMTNIPTMADLAAQGKQPEVLFWVGCAGSFDERAKKITKAFVKLLLKADISFAVLGPEDERWARGAACGGTGAARRVHRAYPRRMLRRAPAPCDAPSASRPTSLRLPRI